MTVVATGVGLIRCSHFHVVSGGGAAVASSWEQLVVGGHGRERAGVGWQAGDDRGRVGEAALGQTDNALLTRVASSNGMTVRTGPTRRGGGVGCVASGFDRDDVRGHGSHGQGGSDPGDDLLVGAWSGGAGGRR